MIRVVEKNLEEVKKKFDSLRTDLIKLEYLESVLKAPDMHLEVKRFAYLNLATLYEKRLMFDKAGQAMSGLAGYQPTFREKIENYISAAEYYAKAMKIMLADDMFVRAMRECNSEQIRKVELSRKNIYLSVAESLEKKSKMAYAAKFYEHLLSLKLEPIEKDLIKKKLIEYYKKVGRFNEARLVEAR